MAQASLIISGIACLSSLIFGILTAVSRFRKTSRDESSSLTTVIVKLENIGCDIIEIKGDISYIKGEVNKLRERVVKVEESAKQAHKRIDEVIRQLNYEKDN